MTIKLVAWDFDGVLNRNIVDGRFVWADEFEADLGVGRAGFEAYLFRSGRFDEAMRGARDLLELAADWIEAEGHVHLDAEEMLAYWFARDDRPDPEMVALVEAAPQRQIIATNNEARRAAFIRDVTGWGKRVERIFAAGTMRTAKPDPAFFARIEDWSGLAPEEILMVDDSAKNVRAAAARGWQVFHFTEATRDRLPARLGL